MSQPELSDAALARLDLSAQARLIADAAHSLALVQPAERHDPTATTALIEKAEQLRDQADELIRRAVIAARERGASWQAIGDQLGVSRQAAEQRFSAAFDRRRNGLLHYTNADNDFRALAAELDTWAAAHTPELDGRGQLVSGNLPATTEASRLADLSWRTKAVDEQWTSKRLKIPAPVSMALAERKHAALSIPLTEDGDDEQRK